MPCQLKMTQETLDKKIKAQERNRANVAIKERLEYELPVLKQSVDPDDTQLVSLIEDYISLCNVYPDAVVISENDGV